MRRTDTRILIALLAAASLMTGLTVPGKGVPSAVAAPALRVADAGTVQDLAPPDMPPDLQPPPPPEPPPVQPPAEPVPPPPPPPMLDPDMTPPPEPPPSA